MLYKKAAEQGDQYAKVSLGRLYYNGLGGPKDIEEAKRLWIEAAYQDDQEAKDYLKKVFDIELE